MGHVFKFSKLVLKKVTGRKNKENLVNLIRLSRQNVIAFLLQFGVYTCYPERATSSLAFFNQDCEMNSITLPNFNK